METIDVWKIIAESEEGFKLFEKLYQEKYPEYDGPSFSSYCEGKGIFGKCGCWLHQFQEMIY